MHWSWRPELTGVKKCTGVDGPSCCNVHTDVLKPSFHYSSSQPELTGRVDGLWTPVHFLTLELTAWIDGVKKCTRVDGPWTRAVNSSSGNWALAHLCEHYNLPRMLKRTEPTSFVAQVWQPNHCTTIQTTSFIWSVKPRSDWQVSRASLCCKFLATENLLVWKGFLAPFFWYKKLAPETGRRTCSISDKFLSWNSAADWTIDWRSDFSKAYNNFLEQETCVFDRFYHTAIRFGLTVSLVNTEAMCQSFL